MPSVGVLVGPGEQSIIMGSFISVNLVLSEHHELEQFLLDERASLGTSSARLGQIERFSEI